MLSLWNLWAMVRRRRMFLIPMIVAFVASVVGVLFIKNMYDMFAIQRKNRDELARAYFLEMDNGALETGLATLLERTEVVRVQAAVRAGDTVCIANVHDALLANRYVWLGQYFSEESYRKGLAQVVVTEDQADQSDLHIGDTYTLCGQDFTVIGIGGDGTATHIPYGALPDLAEVYAMTVVTEEIGTAEEQEAFALFLQETFCVPEVQLPEPQPQESGMAEEDLMNLVVLLLGVVSMVSLYTGYLESRRRMFAVYTLLGCRRRRLVGMLCVETALLMVGMYLLAVAVSRVLFWALAWLTPRFVLALTVWGYLEVFGLVFFLMFGVLGLQLVRFFRKTPNERRRVL